MIHLLNVMRKSFNDLMIIENDEIENKYRTNNDNKYMNFDRYEKDDENENEYEKNQEDKKNKSDDDNNDSENMSVIKIIELFD